MSRKAVYNWIQQFNNGWTSKVSSIKVIPSTCKVMLIIFGTHRTLYWWNSSFMTRLSIPLHTVSLSETVIIYLLKTPWSSEHRHDSPGSRHDFLPTSYGQNNVGTVENLQIGMLLNHFILLCMCSFAYFPYIAKN